MGWCRKLPRRTIVADTGGVGASRDEPSRLQYYVGGFRDKPVAAKINYLQTKAHFMTGLYCP
jgi:hypothetical protein